MFPDRRLQKGFLLPVAMIMIVGIGVMAIAISQIASQSSQSSVVEGLSIQAFYAAESGAQFAMNRLMFNTNSRAQADANCAAVNGSSLNFTANGLQACSTALSCSTNTVAGNPQSFYTIVSAASCGSGELAAERSVEVSSFY